MEELRRRKAEGCRVIVATASYKGSAEKVLSRIGIEPDLLIATESVNLKGKAKLAVLQIELDGKRWAYYGDSAADAPLLAAATVGIKVGAEGLV